VIKAILCLAYLIHSPFFCGGGVVEWRSGGIKKRWYKAMKYLTVGELVNSSGIPETTTRRYLNTFKTFINTKRSGRITKYHPDTLELLKKVYNFYLNGATTEEIFSTLSESNAQIIEIENNEPGELISKSQALDIFKAMQGEIKELRQEVQDLSKALDNRDVKLINQMRNILEEKKKPFWKKWLS